MMRLMRSSRPVRSLRSRRSTLPGSALLLLGLVLLLPGAALARPNYFDAFTSFYGISPGDPNYACGNCHLKWEGTGARNPYGTAVEQQLYLAKPVIDAIRDIETLDTDLDGFSNVDEIVTYGTLPGFSCDNYTIALNTPPFFQSMITPLVPTCLEAMDLLVTPVELTLLTKVGTTETFDIQLVNNGTASPITVGGYAFLPGATAGLSVTGPPLPLVIPVGASATITVQFTPPFSALVNGTLRVDSDDPDEPAIDVPVGGIAFVPNLAPAAKRAECLESVQRSVERLTRTYLKEWSGCFVAELRGQACDAGRRDLRIAQAEQRLRDAIGGAGDRACAGAGLTPSLLGLPDQCGGGCGAIAVTTLGRWADCLICRETESTSTMLDDTLGTALPDLPPGALGGVQQGCTRATAASVQRAIRAVQRKLAACELANVTAASPVDCATSLAAEIDRATANVGRAIDRCKDTSGMAGCRFEPGADPACLADTATGVAGDLVEAVFATE